jgi:hypothetical protein
VPSPKGIFHARTKQIGEERGRNKEAGRSFRDATEEKIDDISHNLRGNKANGQPPSPKAASEPADRCGEQCRTEQEEWNSDDAAKRSKVPVRARIQSPRAVERRARPEQRGTGEAGHRGPEEKENADRRQAAGQTAMREAIRSVHALTIPESQGPHGAWGSAIAGGYSSLGVPAGASQA